MPSGDVSYAGLAASLLLVAVAFGLSRWRRLGVGRDVLVAAARALVQLLVVGAALGLVIGPDRPLVWSWLWVLAMNVVAAAVVTRRAPEVPGLAPLAFAGFAASTAVCFGVLFGFEVFPLESRTVVVLGGLMVGNTLNAAVLVSRRVVEELRDQRAQVEVRLSLGHAAADAARPYVARALRTALIPQIESTRNVGLIALPGAMTGLILAGVDPFDAVLVQAVVMFLVLGSVAITATVVGIGVARRLFTPDARLVELPRPAIG